eukprot:scaffold743_cov267-Pinguiococcus_pyrenoidosus.AAC.18
MKSFAAGVVTGAAAAGAAVGLAWYLTSRSRRNSGHSRADWSLFYGYRSDAQPSKTTSPKDTTEEDEKWLRRVPQEYRCAAARRVLRDAASSPTLSLAQADPQRSLRRAGSHGGRDLRGRGAEETGRLLPARLPRHGALPSLLVVPRRPHVQGRDLL